MEEMVALLRETNALREPILQMGKTVENIFNSITGSSPYTISPMLANKRSRSTVGDFELAIRYIANEAPRF